MITAVEVAKLTGFTAEGLTALIQKNFKKDVFLYVTFLGITNAGQFCYAADKILADGSVDRKKVYVTRYENGELMAMY